MQTSLTRRAGIGLKLDFLDMKALIKILIHALIKMACFNLTSQVLNVIPHGPCEGVLGEGDILTHIDDVVVDKYNIHQRAMGLEGTFAKLGFRRGELFVFTLQEFSLNYKQFQCCRRCVP